MNFDFPDDLKMLRDEARKFLSHKCPTAVPRQILDHGGSFDRALWAEMGAMGWIGASVPEAYGGAGLGGLAVCVLAEEIGRAIAPVPFSSSVYLAIEGILAFGNQMQKKAYLPKLAAGETIGTFAVVEQPGPVRFDALRTRFADGRLSGVKLAVPDGDVADLCLVAAHDTTGSVVLCLADLGGAGVTRETIATFDPTRGHARLTFDGADAQVLAGVDGAEDIRRLMNRAAVLMAFEQVGCAQAALDMATAYAKERIAFGRQIGSFQAIKHKLADVYVAVELARSNAYWGAWALHTNAAQLPLAAATARVSATDAGWLATKENIQTHGGMGYTWEGDAHLYYRRAKLLGITLGGAREWKRQLVAALKQEPATGTDETTARATVPAA